MSQFTGQSGHGKDTVYAHLIMNDNEISGTIVRTSALPEETRPNRVFSQRQDGYIIYCEFIPLRLVIILEYLLDTWHFQIVSVLCGNESLAMY